MVSAAPLAVYQRSRDVISMSDVERVHFGFIVPPEGSRDAGQPIPVCGYLVRHPSGLILFDTGFASVDQETRLRYQPRAEPVEQALARVRVRASDVSIVVNCHLHADHAGGNASFPGIPVYVQQAEVAAAQRADYTVATHTHRFDGAHLEILEGSAEILTGVRIIPTPGHSPGHQVLAVETRDGWLILAGQAYNSASEFGFAAYSHRLDRAGLGSVGNVPPWMGEIERLQPTAVYFAHDLGTLARDHADLGHPVRI